MSSDDRSTDDASSDDDRESFRNEHLRQDFTMASSDSEEDRIKEYRLAEENPEIPAEILAQADAVTASSDSSAEDERTETKSGPSARKKTKKAKEPSSSTSESELDDDEEAKITKDLIERLRKDMKLETDEDGNQKYVFDIKSDSQSNSEYDDEEAEHELMEQMKRLVMRRDGKHNRARRRWLRYEREQKEAEEEAKQFQAYWDRRHEEDRDLWRNKDFANAVDKMSRAGYKGVHGNFDVPEEDIKDFAALFMQITVGDFDGNEDLDCADEWKKLKGKNRIDCQREFIKKANKTITKYGWNPPPGWT